MPLEQSGSKEAFERNVKTELEAGKPTKQAVAIAYSVKRANDGSALPEQVSVAESQRWGDSQ